MALHDDDTGRGDSLDSVLGELKRGKSVPCYLLCGDEEFRLRDALEKITAAPHSRCRRTGTQPLRDGRRTRGLRQPLRIPHHPAPSARPQGGRGPGHPAFPVEKRPCPPHRTDPGAPRNGPRPGGGGLPAIPADHGTSARRPQGRRLAEDRRRQWKRIVPDDGGEGRETWLPKAVELCVSRGAVAGEGTAGGDRPPGEDPHRGDAGGESPHPDGRGGGPAEEALQDHLGGGQDPDLHEGERGGEAAAGRPGDGGRTPWHGAASGSRPGLVRPGAEDRFRPPGVPGGDRKADHLCRGEGSRSRRRTWRPSSARRRRTPSSI